MIGTTRWANGLVVRHGTTSRDEGDFAIDRDPAALAVARRSIVDRPWVWLRQVHGAVVHRVAAGSEDDVRGLEGDALITSDPDVVLAVQTADCVPVTFSSGEGIVGVAHAGWRGIEAGVLEATAGAMRAAGATDLAGHIGPCVHAECYEFGDADLDRLVRVLGPQVEGRTAGGGRALDTVAAVSGILRGIGVEHAVPTGAGPATGSCTSCAASTWYSHRARGEDGRMATVIWREPHEGLG